MDKLYRLILEDTRHSTSCVYFDLRGQLYYGKDEDDLFYPIRLEMEDKFPICLKDLEDAFKLGRQAAKDGGGE